MSDLTTLAEVKDALAITDTGQDTQITQILAGVDGFVASFCARPIAAAARVDYASGGGTSLVAPVWPVSSDPALVLYDMDAAQTVAASSYTIIEDRGIIHSKQGRVWSHGPARWRMTYTGGFAAGSIPEAIKLAIAEIVGARLAGIGGKAGESDMGYSYSLSAAQLGGEGGMPPAARSLLAPYRRA